MTRMVRSHPALFSVAAILIALPLLLRVAAVRAAAAPPASAVSATDLATTLIRAGLDPEALAAADVDAQEATAVVDAFESAMNLEPGRLSSADANYAQAKSTSDSLRRLIQSGRGDENDVAAYQQAMSDLDAAELERQAALDEWFEAGTAGLTQAQVDTLETIQGNRQWSLDIEVLAGDRTEAEWVQLRDALTHERVAPKYNEPVDPGIASYLATVRSDPAVAAAKTCCTSLLSEVEAAWETAIE